MQDFFNMVQLQKGKAESVYCWVEDSSCSLKLPSHLPLHRVLSWGRLVGKRLTWNNFAAPEWICTTKPLAFWATFCCAYFFLPRTCLYSQPITWHKQQSHTSPPSKPETGRQAIQPYKTQLTFSLNNSSPSENQAALKGMRLLYVNSMSQTLK